MPRAAPLLFAALLLKGAAAFAQVQCEVLSADEKKVADAAMAGIKGYACCDGTIAACQQKAGCGLGARLADDVCRLAGKGKGKDDIATALGKRAESMNPAAQTYAIALDDAAMAGEPKAPVTLVAYACSRCPFCKVAITSLYEAVTAGPLKGKVKLYLRPFPLKSHPESTFGDLAMIVAGKQGRFWPYALAQYNRFNDFDPKRLGETAELAGLDRAEFEKGMEDARNRELLEQSKKEGLKNGIDGTPTFFIDGRKYTYDLDSAVLLDVLEEAYERATGGQGGSRANR
jgi:protein-disulfide isomerase